MESPNGQAVKYLQEQRKRKKRMIVFLCLAAIVVVCTVIALRMSGHAMNHTVLDCGLAGSSPHQHTEACYYTPPEAGAEKQLICGMADFVVHEHDEEACYKDGVLVCELPEIKEHAHTEACYETREVLACGLQPGEGGHVHTDECYGLALTCGLEEGEEHSHGDDCYSTVLVCGLDEGDGGHAHTDECYVQEQEVTCGRPEIILHTHGEECYLHTVDQLDEDQIQELARQGIDVNGIAFTENTGELPSEENRLMVGESMPIFKCGRLQVVEHIHDDNDCYKDVGPKDELTSQTGDESTGQLGQRSASYQGDSLQVTVAYEGEDFPENARICIERVDESEKIQQKQEELDAGLWDKAPELKGLFKVTVTSGGEPVDLANPLLLTAVMTDEAQGEVVLAAWYDSVRESLEAQGIYVQSSEPEFELLNLTDQTEQGATAQILPGTVVGIGQKSAEAGEASDDASQKDTENQDGTRSDGLGIINISQAYEYEDEDYQMIFHINGIARPKGESGQPEDQVDNPEEDGEDPDSYDFTEPDSQPADSGADEGAIAADSPEDEALDSNDDNSTQEPQDTQEPLGTAEPAQNTDGTAIPAAITVSGSILPANVLDDPEHPLGLLVEQVSADAPAYDAYVEYIQNETDGLPGLKVMSYKLYYNGIELDLSDCDVELELTAKESLIKAAAQVEEELNAGAVEETEVAPVNMVAIVPKDVQPEVVEETEAEETAFIDGTVTPTEEVAETERLLDSVNEGVSADCEVVAAEVVPLTGANSGTTARIMLRSRAASAPSALSLDETSTAGAPSDTEDETDEVSLLSVASSDSLQLFSEGDGDGNTAPPDTTDNTFGINTVSAANPHFTVQYYGVLNEICKDGNKLQDNDEIIETIIDTRAKDGMSQLPKNTGKSGIVPNANELMKLTLSSAGEVRTVRRMKQLYTDIPSYFVQRPNLKYFEPTGSDMSEKYDLKQIWVLKAGREASSNTTSDWEIYGMNVEYVEAGSNNVNELTTIVASKPVKLKGSVPDFDQYFHFTNNEEVVKDHNSKDHYYVIITDDTVVRLVYDAKNSPTPSINADFYDYDISTGRVHRAKPPEDPNQYAHKTAGQTFNGDSLTSEVLDWAAGLSKWDGHLYAYTKEQGINSSGNYSGSGTKLAFGNVNTGTNLGRLTWSKDGVSNELNKYNNKGYQGCTFGLADKLDTSNPDNWTIQYDGAINAPKLFNEGTATGKTKYENQSLQFIRNGDTYTLTAVNGTGAINLDSFSNPTNSTGTHTDIFTNNFWPMDDMKDSNGNSSFGTGTHDVKFGGTATFKGKEHEIRFGPITQKDKDYTFPESDDGKYHNSYFGMHFSITFDMTKEYLGPLEYLFFGDDDMWVFLTPINKNGTVAKDRNAQLICDIGGVHSSVGEYVDLWDWIISNDDVDSSNTRGKVGTDQKYRLDFFYTERGASGSTCWMQYTLPSVRNATTTVTEEELRKLTIKKQVTKTTVSGEFQQEPNTVDYNGEINDQFLFELRLYNVVNNVEVPLYNAYNCVKYRADGEKYEYTDESGTFSEQLVDPQKLYSGACFVLGNGESIAIGHLPIGTHFTIEEKGVFAGIDDDGNPIIKEGEHDYKKGAIIETGQGTLVDKGSGVYSGEITDNKALAVRYNNEIISYVLPKTGGVGTWGFAGVGCAMVLVAGGLWTRKKKRKR